MATVVVFAGFTAAVVCWGVAFVSGVSSAPLFRRYLIAKGEWRGAFATSYSREEQLGMWRRMLSRTPDPNPDFELIRSTVRRRFLRALVFGGGFLFSARSLL